jgi:hypothetical protein
VEVDVKMGRVVALMRRKNNNDGRAIILVSEIIG